jgi:K+-sensing histidine kinase KdpD
MIIGMKIILFLLKCRIRIGISEDQKKVFDSFIAFIWLVHTTKGTGLGLSLVKQIMDAHKAR